MDLKRLLSGLACILISLMWAYLAKSLKSGAKKGSKGGWFSYEWTEDKANFVRLIMFLQAGLGLFMGVGIILHGLFHQ